MVSGEPELIAGRGRRFGVRRKPNSGSQFNRRTQNPTEAGDWQSAAQAARRMNLAEAWGLVASLAGESGFRRKPEAAAQAMRKRDTYGVNRRRDASELEIGFR